MAGPLAGIRVLDLGRYIACPFCGMLLADLGAEVIRVERSTGGEDRFLGLLTPGPNGCNYSFTSVNRNKKGISLNFERNEKAREILKELVKHSDVVIENFSPEAAKGMGITYENLKAIQPDIIFAHISAFGPTGPYSHRLGFDMIAKAISGAMAISGFPDTLPIREQVFYVDYGTGCFTALGVVSAIYHRKMTGEGQMVDTALLQTAVTYMAATISEWETGKVMREQVGDRGYWVGPTDIFRTKDGKYFMLAIYPNAVWRRFCQFLKREDILKDPEYQTDLQRWEHRDVIDPIVRDWVAAETADELIATADKIPIPFGICYKQDEVAKDPQIQAREMMTWVPASDGSGDVLVTGIPLRMSGTPLKIERSFPAVGEHNEEIYTKLLGYSAEDLARLKKEGIV